MRKIVQMCERRKKLAEKPIEKDSVELENLHIADLKPARMPDYTAKLQMEFMGIYWRNYCEQFIHTSAKKGAPKIKTGSIVFHVSEMELAW